MKRAKIEIISDILFFIKKTGASKPTNILYKANLSFPLLNKYLNALLEDALIAKMVEGKKMFYKITEKGTKFIEILQELNSMTQIIEIYSNKRRTGFSR